MTSRLPLFIGLGVVLAGALGTFYFLYKIGDNRGYAPDQPIPFSHKRHAGDNKIPCLYCHANADRSRHATIPSMDTCMNCHSVVKTDSPLIQKVQQAHRDGKAIVWTKIHDMPDFVFFNHERHIARGVDCTVCHGNVATMDKVGQEKILNMGFCVDCHRENNAPLDCDTCHH